jgi:predicted Zn finger-like uncharacterized protein
MVEVQCSSCHTRYRVDEQVLPEGTPTFKCSRCGHVFTVEPRKAGEAAAAESTPAKPAPSPKPSSALAKPPPLGESPGDEPPQPWQEAQPRATPPPSQDLASPAALTVQQTPEAPRSRILGGRPASVSQPVAESPRPRVLGSTPASTGKKSGTDDLLARPFAIESEETDFGENLTFDFNDEVPIDDEPAAPKPSDDDSPRASRDSLSFNRKEPASWQVGDDPDAETPAASEERFSIGAPPSGRRRSATQAAVPGNRTEVIDETEAPVYNRAVTRSARFFLALFFLVACGFIAITFAIHGAPSSALSVLNRLPVIGPRFTPPIVPAELVALRDVHAEYGHGRDGRLALVVEGNAENVSSTALHTVRIMARIWTPSGAAVARRQVYCGNSIGTRTIAQMTTHEIEFFQELPPPKTFSLDSSAACPFVIVFVDPPPQVAHFDIAVTQADASDDAPSTPTS